MVQPGENTTNQNSSRYIFLHVFCAKSNTLTFVLDDNGEILDDALSLVHTLGLRSELSVLLD